MKKQLIKQLKEKENYIFFIIMFTLFMIVSILENNKF